MTNRSLSRIRPEARRALAGLALGGVLGLGYALFAPRWYQSSMLAVPQTSRAPSLSVNAEGGLGGSADVDLSGNSDVERISAVLQSAAVSADVSLRLDLRKRYETPYADRVHKLLWSHCGVATDRKAKLVTLTCEDRDPVFAQRLVATIAEAANQVIHKIGAASGNEETRFLERRVAEVKREADDAALRLREFEETNKVVDLDAQSRAVVSALSSLRGQQISKELELRYLRSFSSSDDSSAAQIRRQLAAMGGQFRALEQAQGPGLDLGAEPRSAASAGPKPLQPKAGAGPDMFPPALLVPGLQYELSQRVRDRNLSEQNLVFLKQRLENAQAAAAREMSAFQIIDAPEVASVKHRPRGALSLAVGLGLGLLFGLAWAFGPRSVRLGWLLQEAEPDEREPSAGLGNGHDRSGALLAAEAAGEGAHQ